MRTMLVLAVVLAVLPVFAWSSPQAVSGAPGDKDIIAQEESMQSFYASGNVAGMENLMLPDFTYVTDKKISSREETLNNIKSNVQSCSVLPISLNNPVVSILSPDVAAIAYHTRITKTCDRRTIKSDENITTVWVRRDGRWQMHLHTEYLISGFSVQSE